MIQQAIEVKYFGPTNTRGSRMKAFCLGGSITVPWDYAYEADANATLAALALQSKLGWSGAMQGGKTKSGNYVFVFINKAVLK